MSKIKTLIQFRNNIENFWKKFGTIFKKELSFENKEILICFIYSKLKQFSWNHVSGLNSTRLVYFNFICSWHSWRKQRNRKCFLPYNLLFSCKFYGSMIIWLNYTYHSLWIFMKNEITTFYQFDYVNSHSKIFESLKLTKKTKP